MCHYCKMTIVDHQHAAQLVTGKGKIYMFDAIECMIHYLGDTEGTTYAFTLVNDFERPGHLVPAGESTYLISQSIPSPMGAFLSAFHSREAAVAMQHSKGGEVFDWSGVIAHFSSAAPIAMTE